MTAKDGGVPRSQSAQVKIFVDIIDINDNAPQFSQANYTAQVQVSCIQIAIITCGYGAHNSNQGKKSLHTK